MLTIQINLVVIAVCTLLLTVVPLLIAWSLFLLIRTVTRLVKDFQKEFQPLAERKAVRFTRSACAGLLALC